MAAAPKPPPRKDRTYGAARDRLLGLSGSNKIQSGDPSFSLLRKV